MSLQNLFETTLARLGCCSGSIHIRNDDSLILDTQVGLPEPVISLIEKIPKGKGMAGQAWLRREPVMTCNLSTDQSAPIEPGARLVKAQSAIAIPVGDRAGHIVAVVGFAFEDEIGFDTLRLNECEIAAHQIIAQISDLDT